jgi:lipopolysaccharide/colanic/teichoic acid biosynthesis glycosyltransferase
MGEQLTSANDGRITRIGRILRHHKLDELPQLIDVLRGNMSVVGPRPEVPRYVAHYPEELRPIVLSVRPGITDLASVQFRNESQLLTHSDNADYYTHIILPQKLRYYVQYVDEQSFWLDLKIIWLTVVSLFSPAALVQRSRDRE